MFRKGLTGKIKWSPFPAIERAEALINPYCGLYSIYRFYAEPKTNLEKDIIIEDTVLSISHQICLIEINLIDFNDKPLSTDALQNIENIFQYFIRHRKQLIVRFVYDWEGKGVLSEPNDISYILQHMEQLSVILKDLERHIYILQGLFIGSWGEMHNSRYLSERDIITLAKKLYECSGENTQIALRCPNFWRMIAKTYQPLDETEAFSNIFKARFSLFNDGMLASDTDFGTYGHIHAKESNSYRDKWIRKDELEFQNKLCRYVSNGGEVINNCSYNDGAPAMEDLRKMRVSYLHCAYDMQVLNKWKDTKSGLSYPQWKNKSAFEYITAHLGYRFLIKDVKLSVSLRRMIKVKIKLLNTGFAPCYNKFDVKLAVAGINNSEFLERHVNTDTRFWFPDEPVEFEADIPIDELKGQKYILYLCIYDQRTQQTVKIANTYKTGDYEGYYSLGYIKIKGNFKDYYN